jgi:hypothetical protein
VDDEKLAQYLSERAKVDDNEFFGEKGPERAEGYRIAMNDVLRFMGREESEAPPEITPEQAEAGLEFLNKRRDDGEYIGTMWSAECERRLEAGEPLTKLIRLGLDNAARWMVQASTSYWPTGPTWETMEGLFKATEQDPSRFGYRRHIELSEVS